MPIRSPSGGRGGGGGLTLGPPTNSFTGATKAAAETARDTYEAANAAWLAQYDDDATFTIVISWPVTPTNTVYQSRRSSTWVDVTGLVRGPRGFTGSQARFVVYAYINAAIAPTAAPASTTFVRSTGTLTVPALYTAIPSTPASGSKTYRSEAVVNPATDLDSVDLVWGIPAELPAYAAASLAETAQVAAETAQTAAETARTAAQAAQAAAEAAANTAVDIPTGSPRGDLIATSPTLSTTTITSTTARAFAAAELWTVAGSAPADFVAETGNINERLNTPDIHPPGVNGVWAVVEVDGVEIDETILPWGGPAYTPSTGQASVYVSAVSAGASASHVQVRWVPRVGVTASYLQIYGSGTTLPADTVVKIYSAVVRGERGPQGTGGGMGGTNETNLSIAARGANTLDVASDTGTDATIPAATTAASGLQTATDKSKLDGIAASATAVSIADVLAVILAGTGIEIDTTTAGQITISATGAVDPGDHTRRAASSVDLILSEAEVTAGASSTTSTVTLVGWGAGTLEHVFVGVPEDEDDITDLLVSGFSVFASYEAHVDVLGTAIIVSGHKWWRTTDTQDGEFDVTVEIVQ